MVETVAVACKIPMGLILRLKGQPDVRITGPNVPVGERPRDVAGTGYAITMAPRDFMEKWLHDNAQLDMVRNGLIWAQIKDPEGKAREMAAVRSGLEGLDQDKPGPGLERMTTD